MKFLIYAFGPYGKNTENISESMLSKLNQKSNIVKVVFDVKFDRDMIISAIKKHHPDVIIGLGMHKKGYKVKIERKSTNKRSDTNTVISHGGAPYLFVNLKLKKNNDSWLSYNTTDYVCNFSMYIISEHFKDKKFAFLHFPRKYSISKGAEFVEKQLRYISKKYSLNYSQKKLGRFI